MVNEYRSKACDLCGQPMVRLTAQLLKRYATHVCELCHETASATGWTHAQERSLQIRCEQAGLAIPQRNKNGRLPMG